MAHGKEHGTRGDAAARCDAMQRRTRAGRRDGRGAATARRDRRLAAVIGRGSDSAAAISAMQRTTRNHAPRSTHRAHRARRVARYWCSHGSAGAHFRHRRRRQPRATAAAPRACRRRASGASAPFSQRPVCACVPEMSHGLMGQIGRGMARQRARRGDEDYNSFSFGRGAQARVEYVRERQCRVVLECNTTQRVPIDVSLPCPIG